MEPAYHHYLVTCGTYAQAEGIRQAFARARALRHPKDTRQVVFTLLPGHGTVVAEKWVPGTVPFQTIWEDVDNGFLRVETVIPQGPMGYVSGSDGLMSLTGA